MNDWLVGGASLVLAALACRIAALRFLRHPPQRLVRINFAGEPVPAILGWAVVIGIVVGSVFWAVVGYLDVAGLRCEPQPGEFCQQPLVVYDWDPLLGFLILVGGMFAVGLWDDLKGDERPRGFAGHAAALREGVWTGGLVKLVGGGLTSLIAVFVFVREVHYAVAVIAACVALSANLLNLLDRAPGRALKVFVAGTVALLVVQITEVGVILAAPLGAAVAALPLDLKAKAMLGDAGANPLGALLGLSLVLATTSEWGLWTLLGVLVALNLASEKWSFSEIIASNRVLARLDQLGRE